MLETEPYKTHLPDELYVQIEQICNVFKEINQEVGGIVQQGKMPDNTAQLSNVLQATEEATNTILDSATLISELINSFTGLNGSKERIGDHVNRIYEACTFQDISGQRIMKVLKNLSLIETKVNRLAEIAKAYAGGHELEVAVVPEHLLQGPSLEAPSQADIDKLFSS